MSSPPKGALPFPVNRIPIVGATLPLMRIQVNDEMIEIREPPPDASPEHLDAFGALAGTAGMAKAMGGRWPQVLALMTLSYRDRFQPIILGD